MKAGLVGGEGFAVDASLIEADANRSRSMRREAVADLSDPQHGTRAVREYLTALDEQGEVGSPPASTSSTDPAARWATAVGPAFHAYSTNHLVDVQAGIIVDVEATPAWRTAAVNATRTMTDRVEQRFELKPARLIGDMACGASDFLAWMVNEKAIGPHVPVWEETRNRDGALSSSDFAWDGPANECRCPQGMLLRSEWRVFTPPRTRITRGNTIICHATQDACGKCRLKPRCCPNAPRRKITRSIHESAREVAGGVAQTEAYQQSRKDCKTVEMPFAHLKRALNPRRLRLRCHNGARDEFLLAAAAQNLRRMAKRLTPMIEIGAISTARIRNVPTDITRTPTRSPNRPRHGVELARAAAL